MLQFNILSVSIHIYSTYAHKTLCAHKTLAALPPPTQFMHCFMRFVGCFCVLCSRLLNRVVVLLLLLLLLLLVFEFCVRDQHLIVPFVVAVKSSLNVHA